MKRPGARLIGLAGLGALLAQAGHLLVYQLEFGSAAQAVQSQGAHAYFPTLAKTGLGIIAATLLSGLFLIGAARLRPGQIVTRTSRGPSYIRLLAGLFTFQLICFVVQETIESLLAGEAVPSVMSLLFLGSAGQLPVAALAALVFKWLAARIDAALIALRAELAVELAGVAPTSMLVLPATLVGVPALAETCPAVYIKRGPPAILRA